MRQVNRPDQGARHRGIELPQGGAYGADGTGLGLLSLDRQETV